MKITRLIIDNFQAIGHAELDLAEKGLVLIQGENNDDTSAESNGAGKSTVADALLWVLFGETRDGLAADKVVNRTAGKNTKVEVTIIDGDFTYEIVRWRKMNIGGKRSGVSFHVTTPDGTKVNKTGGTDKITQTDIDKALGCDLSIFKAAIYAQQGNMPNLPGMTDTELKRLIEEASGVTTLVRAYEIARTRLRDAEREQDSWRLDHVRSEREVQGIQSRIADLKVREASFETNRKTEIAGMQADMIAAADRAKRWKVKRDDISPENVQKKMDELDRQIEAVHEQNERESELVMAHTEAMSQHTLARSEYNRLVTDAQDERQALDRITERIGQPCGECGKAYCEEDLGEATKLAKEKLRIAVTKAQEKRTDVQELEKVEKDAKSALDAFRASKTDIRAVSEERRRLAVLLVDRANAEREYEREAQDALNKRDRIRTKQAEVNPFGPLLTKAEEELSDALQAYRRSEERGVELEKAIMVAKDVCKVYGPAGVRAHRLDEVTPFLNERTSDYLGTLSDGNITAVWSTIQINAKGELTEKFAISVDKPGDADSFAGLSGGEQRKVKLACALALQDLVASRAEKPIELWIGDEIDDAMDDAGLERLMSVLESMARERGTVLVISHNALNDWIRESALVTRKGGYSTVTGALEVTTPKLAEAA